MDTPCFPEVPSGFRIAQLNQILGVIERKNITTPELLEKVNLRSRMVLFFRD